MKTALAALAILLALSPLSSSQDPATPSTASADTPKTEVPIEAPRAPTPPEVPKRPRLSIGVDSPSLSEQLREKLTPEQLFELEMTKAKNRSAWSDAEDIVVPLVFFLMVFGLIAVPAYLRFRQKRIMHETVRLMAEKGQPIPPELFIEKPVKRSDLRRGIVLCGLGVGLVVFFLCVSPDVWGIGAIPFFIGIGYLVAWRIERGKSEQVSV